MSKVNPNIAPSEFNFQTTPLWSVLGSAGTVTVLRNLHFSPPCISPGIRIPSSPTIIAFPLFSAPCCLSSFDAICVVKSSGIDCKTSFPLSSTALTCFSPSAVTFWVCSAPTVPIAPTAPVFAVSTASVAVFFARLISSTAFVPVLSTADFCSVPACTIPCFSAAPALPTACTPACTACGIAFPICATFLSTASTAFRSVLTCCFACSTSSFARSTAVLSDAVFPAAVSALPFAVSASVFACNAAVSDSLAFCSDRAALLAAVSACPAYFLTSCTCCSMPLTVSTISSMVFRSSAVFFAFCSEAFAAVSARSAELLTALIASRKISVSSGVCGISGFCRL